MPTRRSMRRLKIRDGEARDGHAHRARVHRETHGGRRHVVGLASDGRIACVAKRSTTVRNAVEPMMSERNNARAA